MQPYSVAGAPAHFSSEQGNEEMRASHGEKYSRLVALKDEWDPDNVFHLNQNVRPSGAG